jgi:glycosyltransferase involved in cell wall biosynthesis
VKEPTRQQPPPRIALVGIGLNSYTNANVATALRRAFPGYEVDWFDLRALVQRRTRRLAPFFMLVHGIREFGPGILLRPRGLRRKIVWTSYLFRLRSRIARQVISRRPYRFSMQIQTTFNGRMEGVPHFVYTDNTILANTHNKGVDLGAYAPVTQEWVALERGIYHDARISFVMSRNVGRSIVEDYGCPPDKVESAYGGPNAAISPVERKRYDQRTILFVGGDWNRKGGPELVEAFRLVRKQIPDATLTIIGCSPEVQEPGCRVLGRIPPSDLSTQYASASVFCMPTRFEPFGIVYIEAMAHKVPVVATDIAAIPDFVLNGENGFRVAPYDTQGLANVLVQLLSNPALCRRMGERGHEISKTYTWDNTGRIMRETIERVIGTGQV